MVPKVESEKNNTVSEYRIILVCLNESPSIIIEGIQARMFEVTFCQILLKLYVLCLKKHSFVKIMTYQYCQDT